MRYLLEIISREPCFEGFLKVVRYRLRHSLFAGGWSEPIERERLEYLGSAAAVLYDAQRDQIVMVEQFRIGVLERGRAAWTLEPVGGMLMEDESPEDVVRREAMEEAGCEIIALESIGAYQVSAGTSADRVQLFCGLVNASGAGGIHGVREDVEDTRVVIMDLDQAIGELFTGRMDTSIAVIAIQWLAMNRERVRTLWDDPRQPRQTGERVSRLGSIQQFPYR